MGCNREEMRRCTNDSMIRLDDMDDDDDDDDGDDGDGSDDTHA